MVRIYGEKVKFLILIHLVRIRHGRICPAPSVVNFRAFPNWVAGVGCSVVIVIVAVFINFVLVVSRFETICLNLEHRPDVIHRRNRVKLQV